MNIPPWITLSLGSAIFAAASTIFGKIGVNNVSVSATTTVRAGIMFLTILAVTVLTGKIADTTLLSGKPLAMVILSGVAGALSWLCFFWALKSGKAGSVSSIDRLSIVFVIIMAALFLGEKLTLKTALGATLVAAGAIIVAL